MFSNFFHPFSGNNRPWLGQISNSSLDSGNKLAIVGPFGITNSTARDDFCWIMGEIIEHTLVGAARQFGTVNPFHQRRLWWCAGDIKRK